MYEGLHTSKDGLSPYQKCAEAHLHHALGLMHIYSHSHCAFIGLGHYAVIGLANTVLKQVIPSAKSH